MSAFDPCAVEGPPDPRSSLVLIASAWLLLTDYRDVLLKVAEERGLSFQVSTNTAIRFWVALFRAAFSGDAFFSMDSFSFRRRKPSLR